MPTSLFPGDFFDAVLGNARDNLSGFVETLPSFPSVGADLPTFDQGPRGGGMLFDFMGTNPFVSLPDFSGLTPGFADLPVFGDGRAFSEGLFAQQNAARSQAMAQRADKAPPQAAQARPGVPAQPGVYAPSQTDTRIAKKIYQTATALGLDPAFAAWVAENEGGLDDAAANRRNRRGSQAYGPYQLLIGGGLGDEALAAGIDPRDPNSWERQIEFALNYVAKNGWGKWEAVTARGIDPWTGTPRAQARPAQTSTTTPASTPSGTVPASGYRTQFGYGARYTNPFNPNLTHHQGVDLVVPGAANNGRGSPVGAFSHGGTVFYVASDTNGGLGVAIRDGQGYDHWYFHLDSADVKIGDVISPGQRIGTLGATGIDLSNPTEGGPHLHYEVRVQGSTKSVDPARWMR